MARKYQILIAAIVAILVVGGAVTYAVTRGGEKKHETEPTPTACPAAGSKEETRVRSFLVDAAKGGQAIKLQMPTSNPFLYSARVAKGDPGTDTITDSAPGVAEVSPSDLSSSQLDRVAAAVTLDKTVKPGCLKLTKWNTQPDDSGNSEFEFTFTISTTTGKTMSGTAGGTAAKIDRLTYGHTND